MRRLFRLIALIPLCIFIACRAPLRVSSAEPERTDPSLEQIIEVLPEEVKESLDGNGASVNGGIGPDTVLEKLVSSLEEKGKAILPQMSGLVGTILLISLLTSLGRSISEGCERLFSFISGVILTLSVFKIIVPAWSLSAETISGMGSIMKSVSPIMTAITVSSGAPSFSAANATWLSLLLTLTEQLCEAVLSPLLSICLGFTALCSLSRFNDGVGIIDLSDRLKKTVVFFISFIGVLITVIMMNQSVLASRGDGALLRSIKFASGNLIPIVGGALSEASGSYLSSMALIRSSAGNLITLSLLVYVFPALSSLIAAKLCFGISGVLASLLLGARETSVLKDASSSIDLSLALLCTVTGCFTFAIAAFSSIL